MQLLGTDMTQTTYEEVIDQVKESLQENKPMTVFTPNPEIFLQMSRDEEYQQVIRSADMLLPDGIGIFIAYQIADFQGPKWLQYLLLPGWCFRAVFFEKALQKKYGQRITGSDLTRDVLRLCEEHHVPVVILDQEVGTIVTQGDQQKKENQEKMLPILQKLYPALRVYLATYGTKGILGLDGERSYVLLCTVGGIMQEKLISTIMAQDANVILGMGIGGSIDIITGFREQAPQWLRKAGFEWLYRLYKRPKRHWKRVRNVVVFLFLCIKHEG